MQVHGLSVGIMKCIQILHCSTRQQGLRTDHLIAWLPHITHRTFGPSTKAGPTVNQDSTPFWTAFRGHYCCLGKKNDFDYHIQAHFYSLQRNSGINTQDCRQTSAYFASSSLATRSRMWLVAEAALKISTALWNTCKHIYTDCLPASLLLTWEQWL